MHIIPPDASSPRRRSEGWLSGESVYYLGMSQVDLPAGCCCSQTGWGTGDLKDILPCRRRLYSGGEPPPLIGRA